MLLNEEYLRKVVRESIHSVLMENEQPDWFLNYGFDENFDFANDIMTNCHLWDAQIEEDDIFTLVYEPNDENLGYFYAVKIECDLNWDDYSYDHEGRTAYATPYICDILNVTIGDNNSSTEEVNINVNETKEFIKFLEKDMRESNCYSEESLTNFMSNDELDEYYNELEADEWYDERGNR